MKYIIVIMISMMVVLGCVALPAMAAEEQQGQACPPLVTLPPMPDAVRASQLIDKKLTDSLGVALGQIQDIVVSNGQARYIIASRGDVDQLVPIPFQVIQNARRWENALVVPGLSPAVIDKAPVISRQEWSQLDNPDFQRRVYGYYDISPGGQEQMEQPAQSQTPSPQEPMQEPGMMQERQEPGAPGMQEPGMAPEQEGAAGS